MKKEDFIKIYKNYTNERIIDLVKKSLLELNPIAQEVIIEELERRNILVEEIPRLKAKIKKNNGTDIEVLNLKPLSCELSNEFKDLITKKIKQKNSTEALSLLFLVLPFTITLIYGAFSFSEFFILSFICGIGSVLLLYSMFKYYKSYRCPDYWIDLFSNNALDFAYFFPIVEKVKLNYIIPLGTNHKLSFVLRTKEALIIDILSDNEREIILKESSKIMPFIHYGYNKVLADLLKNNPNNILTILKRRNLYNPIGDMIIN